MSFRCPYCLKNNPAPIRDSRKGTYHCPTCKTLIPRDFLGVKKLLNSSVGVVGFAGHGKTVYLTSLFATLSRFSDHWADYFYRGLDEYTHRILYDQVPLFESGDLPESTPANFPNPALVKYHELPVFGDAIFGFYDTAGEVFSEVAQIARAGFFVAHSDVVLFIVSIPDCSATNLDDDLSRLLDTYIRASKDHLNVNLERNQRLVVIFTKSDLLRDKLTPELRDWLKDGGSSWYALDIRQKLADLSMASFQVEQWVREQLRCARFANMAKNSFKEVRYTIVSALGADFDGADDERPEPLRVLDPFLWLLSFARDDKPKPKPPKLSFWQRFLMAFSRKRSAPALPAPETAN